MQEFFIPLTKIDAERRIIIGRAVQEVPDKTGEILDYATSKPEFERWSKMFSDMSGGLSKGNIRVMHNPKSAAGKVTDMMFNDADKAIDICAKIVDDNEWKKVLEGVYTGFSVGGGYAKKWKDEETGLTRYTARPAEISLVDNPCIPTAKFAELHKADGSTELVKLHGRSRSFSDVYREPAPTFRQVMLAKRAEEAAQPRSFGDLYKADVPRERSESRAIGAGLRSALLHGVGAGSLVPGVGTVLGGAYGFHHGYQADKWRQANPGRGAGMLTDDEVRGGYRSSLTSTVSGAVGGAALGAIPGGVMQRLGAAHGNPRAVIAGRAASLIGGGIGLAAGLKHGANLWQDSKRYEASMNAPAGETGELSQAEHEQRVAAGRASAEKRRKGGGAKSPLPDHDGNEMHLKVKSGGYLIHREHADGKTSQHYLTDAEMGRYQNHLRRQGSSFE